MLNVYEQVDQNKKRSWILIIGFVLVVSSLSWVLGQASGYGLSWVGTALVVSGLISFSSYYWSDKIILSISGAKPASRQEHFNFYTVSENLAMAAGIPKPKLYVIEDTALNAFATGKDPEHAVVCATTGLLNQLDRTELEGVVAHEIAHIQNYDVRLMSLVTVLVGMITLLSDWFLKSMRFRSRKKSKNSNQVQAILMIVGIVLALLSPLIATLMKLALARRREFFADTAGVKLTRQPDGLVKALQKISQDQEPLEAANKATAHLYIANPLKNLHSGIGWFASLFNTHPPIEDRIANLKKMY